MSSESDDTRCDTFIMSSESDDTRFVTFIMSSESDDTRCDTFIMSSESRLNCVSGSASPSSPLITSSSARLLRSLLRNQSYQKNVWHSHKKISEFCLAMICCTLSLRLTQHQFSSCSSSRKPSLFLYLLQPLLKLIVYIDVLSSSLYIQFWIWG